MTTDGRRAIQCTPPDDGAFLRAVSRAYGEALQGMAGEMPLLVGTLIVIRRHYPAAVITLLPRPARQGLSDVVWLVARDGWAAAPHPAESRLQNGAAGTEQFGQPSRHSVTATTPIPRQTHRDASPVPARGSSG